MEEAFRLLLAALLEVEVEEGEVGEADVGVAHVHVVVVVERPVLREVRPRVPLLQRAAGDDLATFGVGRVGEAGEHHPRALLDVAGGVGAVGVVGGGAEEEARVPDVRLGLVVAGVGVDRRHDGVVVEAVVGLEEVERAEAGAVVVRHVGVERVEAGDGALEAEDADPVAPPPLAVGRREVAGEMGSDGVAEHREGEFAEAVGGPRAAEFPEVGDVGQDGQGGEDLLAALHGPVAGVAGAVELERGVLRAGADGVRERTQEGDHGGDVVAVGDVHGAGVAPVAGKESPTMYLGLMVASGRNFFFPER